MSQTQKKLTATPVKKSELTENIHFYYNNEGYMVFTALYLKQRGFCCKNGCKHCPYGYALSSKQ